MSIQMSLLSGFLGATASCIGKAAFDDDSWAVKRAQDLLCHDALPCDAVGVLLRGILVLLMLGCNALMLGIFVESMTEAGSMAATSLASAANFSGSALYGYIFWNDDVWNVQWGIGFAFVTAGVALLSHVKVIDDSSTAKNKKQ